jgi:hypothetical protein
MSDGKIAQTKMVTKNGKTFAQQFWVKPDNASSAAVNRALGNLPPLVANDEVGAEGAAAVALKNAGKYGTYGNPEDFVNAFEAAYDFGAEDSRDSLNQYLQDNDPDEVHSAAYLHGFREGVVARLGENHDNHLDRPRSFYENSSRNKVENDEFLKDKVFTHNPFEKGEKIVIPAGTAFTSTDPSIKGLQHTQTKRTYEVHHAHAGYSDGSVGKLYLSPPSVTSTGTGGYWKDFIVTPAVVEANGQEVYSQSLGDIGEDWARGSRF